MEWNMSRTPPWEVNQREDLDMDVEREKKGKTGMKEKMLTIAHCANANKGDEARFRYHNAKEIGHILALRRDEFR